MNESKIQALLDTAWPTSTVASTRQLTAAGLDDRVLTAAVRAGLILRPRRGAYVQQASWRAAKPWIRDALKIQAHYESTGGNSRYSHVSAARLHECDVWGASPLIHVTTDYANSRTSAGKDVRTHRAILQPADRATLRTRDGREILATSLERTVLDCARILPLEQAAVIGDHALRKGARMAGLRHQLQLGQKRGSRRAENLLNVLDSRSESAGETRTRLLLHSFGMHQFVPQVQIPTANGVFRADFADPATRILIEFDGEAKYFDYRPTAEALLAERNRENTLVQDGWAVFRINWDLLGRSPELKGRLLAFLARHSGPQERH
ncbi:hypothetical protein PSET11_01115 [Arthrobacter ulcerisalmonis]|uniref:DUF559 domain-containing protein n=1 Tax=Arthrobacter ulcerisalmonis TaxID=2483813 RepID=A0A3P5X4D1_9MICC|nr:type IV toxin-antitoxin system AbiEi family antitoxin domain-containing protein [Arthrobacter ulcerisalmonis]VDC23019.1 hypothetical protein PSET11_01115 [Arthrobacter ulcerisalmonis]